MKYIIITFFVISSLNFGFAQKVSNPNANKFEYGLKLITNHSYLNEHGIADRYGYKHSNLNLGYGIGGVFNYHFSNHFYLNTGVSLKVNTIKYGYYNEMETEYHPTFYVPISIRYSIPSQQLSNNFFLDLGMNFLINPSSYYSISRNFLPGTTAPEITEQARFVSYKTAILPLLKIGVGWSYHTVKNRKLEFELAFNKGFMSYGDYTLINGKYKWKSKMDNNGSSLDFKFIWYFKK